MKNFIRYMALHIAAFTVQCILVVYCLADAEYVMAVLFSIAAICSAALGRIAWKNYRAFIADGRIQPAPVQRDGDGYWTHPAFGTFNPVCPSHNDRLIGWQAGTNSARSRLDNQTPPPSNGRTEALHG